MVLINYDIFLIIPYSFILGGYSVGVPPLPIPNRVVKPDRADGSAFIV